MSTAPPASTFLLSKGFLRECGNTDHGIVKAGKDFLGDQVQPSDSGAFFSSTGDEAQIRGYKIRVSEEQQIFCTSNKWERAAQPRGVPWVRSPFPSPGDPRESGNVPKCQGWAGTGIQELLPSRECKAQGGFTGNVPVCTGTAELAAPTAGVGTHLGTGHGIYLGTGHGIYLGTGHSLHLGRGNRIQPSPGQRIYQGTEPTRAQNTPGHRRQNLPGHRTHLGTGSTWTLDTASTMAQPPPR